MFLSEHLLFSHFSIFFTVHVSNMVHIIIFRKTTSLYIIIIVDSILRPHLSRRGKLTTLSIPLDHFVTPKRVIYNIAPFQVLTGVLSSKVSVLVREGGGRGVAAEGNKKIISSSNDSLFILILTTACCCKCGPIIRHGLLFKGTN